MELVARAKFYTRVAGVLYSREGLRGRVVQANRGARHLSLGVRLANPLQLDRALKLAEPLALATNTPAVIVARQPDQPGLVTYQFQLQQGLWQRYTRADLETQPGRVGVGLSEGRRQVDFTFDLPHAGFFGTTGSGKSEAVKSLLCGLFTAYTPDELQAVIIDPDGDHIDSFRNAAHLGGIPIARTSEEADRVLAYVKAELLRRKRANLRDGKRLVVVIDEAEDAMAQQERLAVAQAIGGDGRKFKINLVLVTPDPNEKTLPDLLPKVVNRWVGLVSDGRVSAYLTGHKGLECHKLTGAGDFMHVAGNRQERLLMAMATQADYDQLPRAELTPPEFEDEGLTELKEGVDEMRGPGRPPILPEPVPVAHYLFYGPDNISIAQAHERFGLSRTGHYANRDFACEIKAELMRLIEQVKRGNK
jgi:hypothetical protein